MGEGEKVGSGRDTGIGTLFSEREERIRLLNRRSQREQRSEEHFAFGRVSLNMRPSSFQSDFSSETLDALTSV